MRRNEEGEVRRYLDAGARLLWAGSPRQGIVLRGSDVFMIPFSLLWGGFAVFWEAMVLAGDAPLFFALWGVPFVLMGLYITIGRFWVDARARSNTYYGLTDRRVVILDGLFTRSVTTLPLRTLHDISLTERSDRSGTIALGRSHPFAGFYEGMYWPGMGRFRSPGFEMIEDAKRVHDQLIEAQREAA